MAEKPRYFYLQSGVIPYRRIDGRLQVLLISSRASRHWVIPKGVIELGMDADESAAKEAFEEAGIGGAVHTEAFGKYTYAKWGGTCEVEVFPMEVDTLLDEWPEKHFRRREWHEIGQAIEIVREEGLKDLLVQFRDKYGEQK